MDRLNKIIDRYKLSDYEKEELKHLIVSIYNHEEFQRRMTSEYAHHGEITLGQHIIEVTIISYIIGKKFKNIDLDLVIKIAMFHDLYTLPWQNSPIKDSKFSNKHGFRHPIEAIVNSSIWFPAEYLNEDKAYKMIDGIMHHMFPLPVSKCIDFNETIDYNPLELRNIELLSELPSQIKSYLIQSGSRGRIGSYSFKLPKNLEGNIVVIADKISAIADIKITDIYSIIALITGKNKGLKKIK